MTFLLPPGVKELIIWETKLDISVSPARWRPIIFYCIFVIYRINYWRMDQINFFNDCSPQTLLVLPFLNTLFHILIAFWESNSHLEFGKFDSMQNITSETLSVWTKMFLGKSASFLQNIFSHINITVNQKWGTISML